MRRLLHGERRRTALRALQVVLLAVLVVVIGLEVRNSWSDIRPRLSLIDRSDVAFAALALAAYYLAFVPGWMLILRAFGMRIHYADALGAEMLSMLAKYIPGGVWTPAARVVYTRRLGLPTAPVLASIGYEAGLSAISGVIVFALALPFQDAVQLPVPLPAILGFAAFLVVLLHPRIFGPLAERVFGRIDDTPIPRLPLRAALAVLGYYVLTWLLGGLTLYFLVQSVGDVSITNVPFLGGVSAIGAIVAVLVVLAPSGLGVREGAMYLLLAEMVDPTGALLVVALNRLLLTGVEIVLLGVVAALRRGHVLAPTAPGGDRPVGDVPSPAVAKP